MPPSYEEVTGTSSSSHLYDEVYSEAVHRYDDVPDTDIYEQNQVCNFSEHLLLQLLLISSLSHSCQLSRIL